MGDESSTVVGGAVKEAAAFDIESGATTVHRPLPFKADASNEATTSEDDGTVAAGGSVGSGCSDRSDEVGTASRRRGRHPSSTTNGRHLLVALLLVGAVAALVLGLGLGLGLKNQGSSSSTGTGVVTAESNTSSSSNGAVTNPDTGAVVPEVDEGENGIVPDNEDQEEDPNGGQGEGEELPPEEESQADEDITPTDGKDESVLVPPEDFASDAMEWPQLVGMDGDVAATLLEESYPGYYDIIVLHEDAVVSMDFVLERIRIYVDDDNIVTKVPKVG